MAQAQKYCGLRARKMSFSLSFSLSFSSLIRSFFEDENEDEGRGRFSSAACHVGSLRHF